MRHYLTLTKICTAFFVALLLWRGIILIIIIIIIIIIPIMIILIEIIVFIIIRGVEA